MKILKGITSFVAVASSGSFSAAAKIQGVSAVAIGKNISNLERQLGVQLIQRTTRALSLTLEGHTFFQQCEGPLRELLAAQAMVQGSGKALSGVVRVTSVAPIGQGYLMPLLPEFHSAHPNVHIELHLDDSVTDIVSKGFDVGIRVGRLKDSGFIARPIAALPFVVCASQSYLKQSGLPHIITDLASHNCIRMRRTGSKVPFPWFLSGSDAVMDKSFRGNFSVNDFHALLIAAVQGQGLVCVPLPLAMPLFRAGQLRPVLTNYIDPQFVAYLYYPARKNLPERTRAFVDFTLKRLGQEPDLQTPHQDLLAPFIIHTHSKK